LTDQYSHQDITPKEKGIALNSVMILNTGELTLVVGNQTNMWFLYSLA